MQIQTQCRCGAKFGFSQDQIGDTFRCSVCHQVFEVPSPGQKPVMAPGNPQGNNPQTEKPVFTNTPHRYEGPSSGSSAAGCWIAASIIGLFSLFVAWTMVGYTSSIGRIVVNKKSSTKSAYRAINRFEKATSEYEDKGFKRAITVDDVSNPLEQNTMFTGQFLELDYDSDSDLAIFSQEATLNGEIEGKVDFFGQRITIGENAIIHDNVNLRSAEQVTVFGEIKGELTGSFQSVVGKEKILGGLNPKGSLSELIQESVEAASKDQELKQKKKEKVLSEIQDARNALEDNN